MTLAVQSDEHFMRMAMQEAEKSFEADEVPVGAVIACKGRIIARAHNLMQRLNDVTAHAEMQAITAASEFLGSKYLTDCTIYITLEPCVMCAGALFWSQIPRVVFGAYDDKRGFLLLEKPILHPKTEITGGVLGEESAALLKEFFARKRQ